jgi:WD40 repeat protein
MGNKNIGEMHPPSFAIETPDTVTGIFLSPNKQFVVIGVNNKNIRIYDIENQEMKIDVEGCCYSKMTNNVINVAFNPDGSQMAYRWEEGVRLLNMSTFEMEKEINNQHTWVSVSYSPDGKFLAIGGTKDLLSIYDLSKDTSMALIKQVEARIHQHV